MSLFNPYVLLGVILAILASFGSGYYKGGQDEFAKQQMEIARLNEEARVKEQALVAAVQNQTNQLVKAENNAKLAQQKRNSAIDSGALRLRIPVKAASCPTLSAPADTPAPAGDSVQTTAELDSTTARLIVAITDQGDSNTRQLNACIDAYNTVYQTLKEKQ
jgi:ATPase subunit of ABC transporter with duplicated ATPase domains